MKTLARRILSVAAILIAVAYMTQSVITWFGCKQFVQKLPSPDGKHWYVLFWDHDGPGDPSWHGYEVPSAVEVESLCVKRDEDDSALFANYSEAGEDTEDAGIEIIQGKYLVMRRGGLYHSLYDIGQAKVLVNEWCPYAAYLDGVEPDHSRQDVPIEDLVRRVHDWTAVNLDARIRRILEGEPPGS